MDWITNNIINIGITSGLFLLLGIAIKKLPGLIESKVQKAIEDMFQAGDAADDAFIVAAIKWAEYKYGPGTGETKAKACVGKIIDLLPVQYRVFVSEKSRNRAIELFQQSFDRLEAVAKKAIETHQ